VTRKKNPFRDFMSVEKKEEKGDIREEEQSL